MRLKGASVEENKKAMSMRVLPWWP